MNSQPSINKIFEIPAIIKVENLYKSFGNFEVLKGINLAVAAGTILALLGPNGAGKTTLIKILTTLLKPDKGRASVAFYDVVRDAKKLREKIGLAGQYAAVDENLTGEENLKIVGRLYHIKTNEVEKRAAELLERFDLTSAGKKLAKNYSGGMRRRLDLAASLLAKPQVLFLDEPTTGLDPQSRIALWEIIRELVNEGATILLTTQYMEEADQLAHTIAVIDQGKIIAQGTSEDLKSHVGGNILEIEITEKNMTKIAAEKITERAELRELGELKKGEVKIDQERKKISLPIKNSDMLAKVIILLDTEGIKIQNAAIHRPTLDDVFLALTGHKT